MANFNSEESNLEEEATPIPLDRVQIKKELIQKCAECQQRGLVKTYKWLSEMLYALRNVTLSPSDLKGMRTTFNYDEETDAYLMAKSYFDLKEYERCAHFTKNLKKERCRFLHYYSRYLCGEKKRLDDATDHAPSVETEQLEYLLSLRQDLELDQDRVTPDGYIMYIYGIVLKRLALHEEAKEALIEAVNLEPCHWGSWLELATYIEDKDELTGELELPNHWVKHLFTAYSYLELHLNIKALEIFFGLQIGGLMNSTFILAQIAIAFHNMREVDRAVQYFKQLSLIDPLRLENLDTYSNLLYVKENNEELAYLAHKVADIDKYRTETCCVIGNYYSLRSQHEKAITYFQRAIKLNPQYLSAWTLLGHEFIELKSTNAAIQCYRHALEVNKRDYRAWYGLGQTYEMLKMPYYGLYYYKKAQELRPDDSRMLVALGESFEKLEKLPEAVKCFSKAYRVGDIEGGIALSQLAGLLERLEDEDQAAGAYNQFIIESESNTVKVERDHLSKAFKFLAQYCIKHEQYDRAYEYAQKCTEFTDAREEAKSMLKEIANRRVTEIVSPKDASLDKNVSKDSTNSEQDHSHDEPMNLSISPS